LRLNKEVNIQTYTQTDNCVDTQTDSCVDTQTDSCVDTQTDSCVDTQTDSCVDKQTDRFGKTAISRLHEKVVYSQYS